MKFEMPKFFEGLSGDEKRRRNLSTHFAMIFTALNAIPDRAVALEMPIGADWYGGATEMRAEAMQGPVEKKAMGFFEKDSSYRWVSSFTKKEGLDFIETDTDGEIAYIKEQKPKKIFRAHSHPMEIAVVRKGDAYPMSTEEAEQQREIFGEGFYFPKGSHFVTLMPPGPDDLRSTRQYFERYRQEGIALSEEDFISAVFDSEGIWYFSPVDKNALQRDPEKNSVFNTMIQEQKEFDRILDELVVRAVLKTGRNESEVLSDFAQKDYNTLLREYRFDQEDAEEGTEESLVRGMKDLRNLGDFIHKRDQKAFHAQDGILEKQMYYKDAFRDGEDTRHAYLDLRKMYLQNDFDVRFVPYAFAFPRKDGKQEPPCAGAQHEVQYFFNNKTNEWEIDKQIK